VVPDQLKSASSGSCHRAPVDGCSPSLAPPARRGKATKVLWSSLFVAAVSVGLWAGAHRQAPVTLGARVERIAAKLRCPVCIDESAAQANTAAARAIRADIAARLRRGQSETEIMSYMVSRYGPWILLSPPTSGVDMFVWVAPVVVTVGALGIVVFSWARASRSAEVAEVGETSLCLSNCQPLASPSDAGQPLGQVVGGQLPNEQAGKIIET
jgi:cytochrome c-type biogenesis protein CcmH